MSVPRNLITASNILELFIEKGEDMHIALANEIVFRIYKDDYFSILYTCGHDTLIILLNYFEEMEEYEVCVSIRDTINEHNNLVKDNLPTK